MDNETLLLLNDNKKSENEMELLFTLKALRDNKSILDNAFVFEKVVYVLNEIKPNVNSLEPASLLMIAKAVKYLNKIFKEDLDWHNEIKLYIAHVAHDEGWANMPTILSFAENELQMINVKHELDDEQKRFQGFKHRAVEMYCQ